MNAMLFWRGSDTAKGPTIRPAPQSRFVESVHLVVLTTFGITQPVYDRLGLNPVFLSDSGVDPPGVLLLVAFLSIVIPGGVAGILWGVGRFAPRAHSVAYSLAIFVLWVLIALPIVKRIEQYFPSSVVVGTILCLSLLVAAAATWGYFAYRPLRSIVSAGALGTLVFPVLFVFFSHVWSLFEAPPVVRTERWKPVPVVMVVFDEFRGTSLLNEDGDVDAERFPNFAELARHSTRFANATTVHHDTLYAVPALLSGRYPATVIPPTPSDLPQNLFSVLEATHTFEQAVFEPVSRLATDRVKMRLTQKKTALIQATSVVPTLARVFLVHVAPSDLQRSLPEIPRLWFGLHDDEIDRTLHRGVFRYAWGKDRREQFEHFLECIDGSPIPALFFNHVLLPHVPWCYLPSGRRYLAESNNWELLDFNTHGGMSDAWGSDELYLVQSQQRQLLQLQYSDALVGRLLDRLRETGLFDKCLLVVTADHGISFAMGESRRYPYTGNLGDIMSIPLFVKLPGQQRGDVNDRNVEAIDILPTIAEVLGIELPMSVDGRSMFDTTTPERAGKMMYRGLTPNSAPATVVSQSRAGHELRTRFGRARDPGAMYRIGPHPELIGRTVHDLPPVAPSSVQLELIRSGSHYSSDRDALVPCYIEGRVVAPAGFEMPVTLAVAVNGVIQATTRTYLLDGLRDHWSAMIPEAAYHDGENDVQYYVVSGDAPDWRLVRCPTKVVAAGR